MAIAFDTTALGNTFGTSLSFPHTMSSTSNGLLIVGVNNTTSGTTIIEDVTGVTYNSVSLTKLNSLSQTIVIDKGFLTLWYLLNPATGVNNVVISVAKTLSIEGLSSSYTGVSQSGFPDASSSQIANSATSITGTVTTVTDNSWGLCFAANSSGSAATITIYTQRVQRATSERPTIGDSNGVVTPPGNSSATYTSGSGNYAMSMVSFAPASVTPATSTTINMMMYT